MVGLPDETPKDFGETVKCCRECQPDDVWLYVFYPYPGTDLHDYCKSKGYLPRRIDPKAERSRAVLNMPGFARKEIQRQYTWFYHNVYKGRKPIYITLSYAIRQKIRSVYFLNSLYGKAIRNKFVKRITNLLKLS